MPRVYVTKGELRRREQITTLFTLEEKERIRRAATDSGLDMSLYVRRIVLSHLEQRA